MRQTKFLQKTPFQRCYCDSSSLTAIGAFIVLVLFILAVRYHIQRNSNVTYAVHEKHIPNTNAELQEELEQVLQNLETNKGLINEIKTKQKAGVNKNEETTSRR